LSKTLTLGKIARPRGLRGEFFLDAPVTFGIPKGTAIGVGAQAYPLESLQIAKDRALVKLKGLDSIDAIEPLRGTVLTVERSALGGDLLLDDLLGCVIIDATTGRELGTVADWHQMPGQAMLELDNGMLIPFVKAFFPEVDPAQLRLVAHLPPGFDQL
jgi:16S rRNA processing protein RimM